MGYRVDRHVLSGKEGRRGGHHGLRPGHRAGLPGAGRPVRELDQPRRGDSGGAAGLLGTVVALLIRGLDNNVYTQIGIVLLIALASKNAILIVEFAATKREKGKGILEAAVDAARLRFRPILMTAISSIAGFLPLVVATGAGAASRQAIGTAVVGGMIAATVMSLLFTPVFFVVMQKISEMRKKKPAKEPKQAAEPVIQEGSS